MNEILVRKNVEPVFFLVSSCLDFFKVLERISLLLQARGGAGAHSQECHELLSPTSHIGNEWKLHLMFYSSTLIWLNRDCSEQGRQTGLGNSLKKHCSLFHLPGSFEDPEKERERELQPDFTLKVQPKSCSNECRQNLYENLF